MSGPINQTRPHFKVGLDPFQNGIRTHFETPFKMGQDPFPRSTGIIDRSGNGTGIWSLGLGGRSSPDSPFGLLLGDTVRARGMRDSWFCTGRHCVLEVWMGLETRDRLV